MCRKLEDQLNIAYIYVTIGIKQLPVALKEFKYKNENAEVCSIMKYSGATTFLF
jgi:hypothetical protein